MVKIVPNIEKLLRTNTALVFLCVISIGVLILLFRHSSNKEPVVAPIITPISSTVGQSSDFSSVGVEDLVPSLSASPFRNAPAPEALPTFVFKGQATAKTSFTCTDVYDVALIYPMSIDYRLYPLSSLYNRATPCAKGTTLSQTISLEHVRTETGSTYYIVRAHQGKKGGWYAPY